MDKASTGSLLLARTLVQSITSPALRPTSRFLSSPSFSFSSASSPASSSSSSSSSLSSTALRQPCAAARPMRLFSSTAAAHNADQPPEDGSKKTATATSNPLPASSANLMEGLADLLPSSRDSSLSSSQTLSSSSSAGAAASGNAASSLASALGGLDDFDRMKREVDHSMEEYHFAIYAHKHNTHVTVSKPNNDVILSLSCGNIGFRKSHRGTYDAAYQLGAYACDRMYQNNWHKNIQKMRVTLRGFGPGREAISKILLGTEGRLLRNKITQVADITRLKFGGTRSKKPRRLG